MFADYFLFTALINGDHKLLLNVTYFVRKDYFDINTIASTVVADHQLNIL